MSQDDAPRDESFEASRDEAVDELQDNPNDEVQSLHVIAHQQQGISQLEPGVFESRSWKLAEGNATVARTGFFFAHETSQTPPYLAGRIIRFESDPERGRWVVVFEVLNLSMPWPNGVAHGNAVKYGPAPPDAAVAQAAPAVVAVPEPGTQNPQPTRHLYVAENSRLPGSYKVGVSGHPQQRMAELERSHNFRMRLVAVFYDRADVEQAVHQALEAHRDQGGPGTEWFQAPLLIILETIISAVGTA
jgi:T5orf172 domain